MIELVTGILGGAIAGAAYGIVGYVRNNEDGLEQFDWNSFVPTVLGSAAIGGYAFYSGGAIDIVSSSAIGVVITQAVKKLYDLARLKLGA